MSSPRGVSVPLPDEDTVSHVTSGSDSPDAINIDGSREATPALNAAETMAMPEPGMIAQPFWDHLILI